MSHSDRQASLRREYGQLYVEVSQFIREADPIHLIAIGAPSDEYNVEVSTILPRLRDAKSSEDVHRIVYEEFVHWFDADIAGPPEIYMEVAERIWETWQRSPAGPNRGVGVVGHRGVR